MNGICEWEGGLPEPEGACVAGDLLEDIVGSWQSLRAYEA